MKRGCGPDGLKEQGSKAECGVCEQRAHRHGTPTPRVTTHVQGTILGLYSGHLSVKLQKLPVGRDAGEWL